jgi:putative transposase
MSNYRRLRVPGATYFFTVKVWNRRRVNLTWPEFRPALREGIQQTRLTLPFTIDAWVLLPDHLHCLWTLPPNDTNYSARWAIIKRYVSQHCGTQAGSFLSPSRKRRRESGIWQRRFWEHVIRDDHDFEKHFDYTHWNPVKHGYVTRVRDWPYSTFHRYVNAGIYPLDWGGVPNLEEAEFGE